MRISSIESPSLLESLKKAAPRLCSREGDGVGADGILVLQGEQRTSLTPSKLVIINSDGSTAANCGNGLRCAAGSVLRFRENGDFCPPDHLKAMDSLDAITLEVGGVDIVCRYMSGHRKHGTPLIAVEMGVPVVNDDVSWFQDAVGVVSSWGSYDQQSPLHEFSTLSHDIGVCEIGNPHIVFFGARVERDALLTVGPALQSSQSWDGINVHLVNAREPEKKDQTEAMQTLGGRISEVYQMLVWERGAGETKACGSGACAVAVCSLESGLIPRNEWIAVDMPGGRLYIKQKSAGEPVTMAGPACFVFDGELEI